MLEEWLVRLRQLRPIMPDNDSFVSLEKVIMVAEATAQRGNPKSRAMCVRALRSILSDADIPARLRHSAETADLILTGVRGERE